MKPWNLFLCLLIGVTCATVSAQEEGQDWKKGEYEELLATNPKLFVYPDGRYLIAKKMPQKSGKVAFSVLFFHRDIGKVKPEGRLSEKFVRKYLKGMDFFDPVPVMARPPCCPVYAKDGSLIGSVYPPNGCPGNCKKPLLIRGKTYQMDCCLPQDMLWEVMAGINVQPLPSSGS